MIKLIIILVLIGITFSAVKKWVVYELEKAIYIKGNNLALLKKSSPPLLMKAGLRERFE